MQTGVCQNDVTWRRIKGYFTDSTQLKNAQYDINYALTPIVNFWIVTLSTTLIVKTLPCLVSQNKLKCFDFTT